MKAFDANWGPRFDMILSGSPKRLYRFSNSSCAVSSAVIVFEHGIRIIPFVNPWLTTTRMESYPFTDGRSVMKSIEQFAKVEWWGLLLLEEKMVSSAVGQS